MDDLTAWFGGRCPEGWFEQAPEVMHDRDEVLVVGRLPHPAVAPEAGEEELRDTYVGRIELFREETRPQRMAIADEAQRIFRRKVSWGARCGGEERIFTHLSTPVMTRLRMPQRKVLDTLIEAGVARSRSEALAWCVALVGKNESRWIKELRDALVRVREVRTGGPDVV